ncbi:MAG: hypothetical protein KF868_00710 [Acidobacteria bacterium]|nr:hypothetical protein [Acidobacteriota bacterium]MCW5969363.1 hypothetical protein [Blastocatellales bacterium]
MPLINSSASGQTPDFLNFICTSLKRLTPASQIEYATLRPDRARTVLPGYARIIIRRFNRPVLVIAADPASDAHRIDGVASAGLLWLAAYNSLRKPQTRAQELWYMLPCGKSETALSRLSMLSADHLGAAIRCFEFDPQSTGIREVEPEMETGAVTFARRVHWPANHRCKSSGFVDYWRNRIIDLSPDLIDVHSHSMRCGLRFSINGLDFARVDCGWNCRTSNAFFGVAGCDAEKRLDEDSFGELVERVGDLVKYRCAHTPDRRHPFYRLRPEAWLESLLRRDICALDPALDARFVYSQTPALRGDQRAILDLLAVDKSGRLVVIEIKAVENAQLPIQGLDYWMLVDAARQRGEFQRRGIFPGVELADAPPRLYLVTPRLRLHRSFPVLAGAISRRVDLRLVGLNSNWRDGVQVRESTR